MDVIYLWELLVQLAFSFKTCLVLADSHLWMGFSLIQELTHVILEKI
ncbi:hypothetical protein LEP1GSC133_4142 [Leptospira borgpetersenii serovar Pomona str. 200901868]|uniref:Uncharacterized protein n=1 Tax=Leptospira borgpetersenii serovar Pomona str. 200901868 TaxID=1192866 RepID=M6W1U0_LEPBO|nr:hypothetical protein LEP1GSC133_4142 [Leptospira borgpetersenii serovar Pomona str. 200901868]